MKRFGHSLWAILLLLVAACGGGSTPNNTRFEPYPEEAQVLGLVNAFRGQARICGTQPFTAAPALTWVEAVGDAAWFHSVDMGRVAGEGHQGASTEDRLRARGFDPGPVAESRKKTNRPANASDAFSAWAADPAACASMMNPTFTVMGAGMSGQWDNILASNIISWTLILTTPRANAPTPPATLTVSPTTASVTVGGAAISFSATLTNSTNPITWTLIGPGSVSSTTGANINYTPPTAGGAGTAILTAKAGTLTATATITVNAATPAPSLDITPAEATTSVGGAPITFTATTNTNQNIGWALSAASPGSISNTTGNSTTYTPPATGGAGTALLCAATSANLSKCVVITINAPAPAPTLTVSPTTSTVTVGGAAVAFSATLTNSNATVNWALTGPGSLSAATGATTTYTPPSTGGAGTATLTASAAGLTASTTITINAAAPTLTVSPTTATTQVGGANVIITASSNQVSWSMTGPGTFSWAGSTFTYIPPASGNGGTATVTATLGTLTASAVITVSAPPPPPPPDLAPFLTLINEFRSQPRVCMNGTVAENMPAVPPVAFQAQLNTAARLHSEDMATNNYFSHTGLNGSTFVTRIAATGYPGTAQGENIAAGNSNVQGAFDNWRNSTAGHCQAMMSANANEIGLGYGFNANSQWTHYWTLVFGKR